jgi:hypothetical protein
MTDATAFLTPEMLPLLIVILVVEFGLLVWAVVDWIRRPPSLIRGNRIAWLIAILLVNIVGPIVYLTVGRLHQAADDIVGDPEAARRAADTLYPPGPKEHR